jgi:hypothetical protein
MTSRVPVLLLAWRRPSLTKQVIDAIRVASPSQMFVACDGANAHRPDEAELVASTRATIDHEIDWQCTVERLYSESNQGCRRSVSRAISWFFDHVAEGIILEDDCVVHPDFFPYCAEMLERYREDHRVWCISGDNSAGIRLTGSWSYGFIRTTLIWGWATWRRAWKNYDDELLAWRNVRSTPLLNSILTDPLERKKLTRIFDSLLDLNEIDSWGYRWNCSALLQSGLCAVPTVNLVTNVGFSDSATHTKGVVPRSFAPRQSILPLKHPPIVHVDRFADAQVFEKVHGGAGNLYKAVMKKLVSVGLRLSRPGVSRIRRVFAPSTQCK